VVKKELREFKRADLKKEQKRLEKLVIQGRTGSKKLLVGGKGSLWGRVGERKEGGGGSSVGGGMKVTAVFSWGLSGRVRRELDSGAGAWGGDRLVVQRRGEGAIGLGWGRVGGMGLLGGEGSVGGRRAKGMERKIVKKETTHS